MRLKFPHISRFFSARVLLTAERVTLWSLLLALFGFNAFAAANYPLPYSDKLSSVFARPFSWDTHAALARDFWQLGAREPAVQELLVADELYQRSPDASRTLPAGRQVLGLSTAPSDLLASWQHAPARELERQRYWEEIIKQYPDYRDAYVELAALLYKQGNVAEAKTYLLAAEALDPNNVSIQKLVAFVSKIVK